MFDSWVRKMLKRREWVPTLVILPEEFHGQRSLIGYSPWGHKESDTTERLHFLMQNVNNRKTVCRGEKEHMGTLYFPYNLPRP